MTTKGGMTILGDDGNFWNLDCCGYLNLYVCYNLFIELYTKRKNNQFYGI